MRGRNNKHGSLGAAELIEKEFRSIVLEKAYGASCSVLNVHVASTHVNREVYHRIHFGH